MARVISFFFLGTTQHRRTDKSVITSFYNAVNLSRKPISNTKELDDPYAPDASKMGHPDLIAHLFDGVGSHPGSSESTHPSPGTYVYDPKTDVKKRTRMKVISEVKDAMKSLTGAIAGDGMDELLFEALSILDYLKKEDEKALPDAPKKMPEVINIQGFSRGADAGVRLANLIAYLYPGIKVNLFLIDQVPGPKRGSNPLSYTIPENVDRFEAAVMQHEYRPGFSPQTKASYIFASPNTTKVSIKAYPGAHYAGAGFSDNDEATAHVPLLVHDDFDRFLRETGSLLQNAKVADYVVPEGGRLTKISAVRLNPHDRFKLYNQISENAWFYSKGYRYNEREILQNMEDYSENLKLFVNQEHHDLFKSLYPATFDWFFNGGAKPLDKSLLWEELKSLENSDDSELIHFYKNFRHYFDLEQPLVQIPAARKAEYRLPPLGKPLVCDELSYLQEVIRTVMAYEKHHPKMVPAIRTKVLADLQLALNTAKKQDSDEALITLNKAISTTINYLDKNNQKTFMYVQLSKVELLQSVEKIYLANHLNMDLHKEHRILLIALYKDLKEINADNQFNYFEKSQVTRQKMRAFLHELDVHHLSENMHQFYNDSENRGKVHLACLNELSSSLKELSKPIFEEKTLAGTLIKRLNAYQERNRFSKTIFKILVQVFPSTKAYFPVLYKEQVAQEIKRELEDLVSRGEGNSSDGVTAVLEKGKGKLREHLGEDLAPKIPDELTAIFSSYQKKIPTLKLEEVPAKTQENYARLFHKELEKIETSSKSNDSDEPANAL